MIRYLFSTGLFVYCLGLPLLAKEASCLSLPGMAKSKSSSIGRTSNIGSKTSLSTKNTTTASTKEASSESKSRSSHASPGERLARLTAYWAGEGDYYTGHGLSSTGIHLHEGHCAVDPRIIPYGSRVHIDGLGTYTAVDTGSAVVSREAAKGTGHNSAERSALVIDLFFENRRDGQHFAASGPKFASITWTAPESASNIVKKGHSLVATD